MMIMCLISLKFKMHYLALIKIQFGRREEGGEGGGGDVLSRKKPEFFQYELHCYMALTPALPDEIGSINLCFSLCNFGMCSSLRAKLENLLNILYVQEVVTQLKSLYKMGHYFLGMQ